MEMGTGARAIASAFLTLVVAVGTSACNSSSANPNLPPASPISVTPGTLAFAGASAKPQTFAVTDTGFGGTFAESSTCAGVATIAPQTSPAVGPKAVWTVTPAAPGTCNVQISDGTGAANVSVTVSGPLTANPTSLSFAATSANAQTITVSEYGYSGSFTESDTCAGPSIATVSPSGTVASAASLVIFTVTPNRVGTCSITFADAAGTNVVVPVGVL